jgi:hypothetical protein
MTPYRDSDTASFLSTNSDLLSSPTDGYFNNRSQSQTLPQDMYIDTDAANKGSKPRINVTEPRSNENSPLLESFVGQAPPPSYLEATTPNPWNTRPSGDEGVRLLSFDGRGAPGDAEAGSYKGWSGRRRSFREHCSRKRMLKWMAAVLFLVIFTRGSNKDSVSSLRIPNTLPICNFQERFVKGIN